RERIGCTE
ncbi:toprim domain protein, partial [Vibrio parahaemolyticus EKP-021]